MEATVVIEYDRSQNDREMSVLKVGDVIKDVVQLEGDDYFGILNGKGVRFSRNFVKLRTVHQPVTVSPTTSNSVPTPCSNHGLSHGSGRHSTIKTATVSACHDECTVPDRELHANAEITEKARVIVAFEAFERDELSVKVGNVVEILNKTTTDEGWWKVRLGKIEGVVPKAFLKFKTDTPAPTQVVDRASSEQEPYQLMSLVLEGDNYVTPNAVSSNVTVGENKAELSQTVPSDNTQTVVPVQSDIRILTSQDKGIPAHCMLIPILFSSQALAVVTTLCQSCGVNISLMNTTGQNIVCNVSEAIRRVQGCVLQKVHIKDYLIPTTYISQLYTWTVIDSNTHERKVLSLSVNQHLNSRYHIGGQDIVECGGIRYVVDFSAMTLTDPRSNKTVALCKEALTPSWFYSLEQNNEQFFNFVEHDSIKLESVYRYGGPGIVLSGVEHLVDFIRMCKVNLASGQTTSIKRQPLPFCTTLPDYNAHLMLSGPPERLDEAAHELMRQLELLCSTTSFTFMFNMIAQHWQDSISIHAFNVLRQYCVKVVNIQLLNGVLTVQLKGEQQYCESVKDIVVKELLGMQQYAIVKESNIRTCVSLAFPTEWESQTSNVAFKPVRNASEEWRNVEGLMHKTLPSAKVVQVDRIQNCQLWEKYALERSHMEQRNIGIINEKFLFHGTRKTNPRTVASSLRGIDFRLSRRDHQLLWGNGTYFAVNASYSDRYSHENCGVRELILVKVLTGHTCRYNRSHPSLTRPPPLLPGSDRDRLYDTVSGFAAGSDIYVVYDHDRAYPAYIVSYRP